MYRGCKRRRGRTEVLVIYLQGAIETNATPPSPLTTSGEINHQTLASDQSLTLTRLLILGCLYAFKMWKIFRGTDG